jgi:very-short-patch-repair endonuclease
VTTETASPEPEPATDIKPKPVDTRRPFSRADAIKAGIDSRLFRGSRFRRIFRGVYIEASVAMTPKVRAEAALVPFHESAFASHASAARIHGVPIPTLPDEHVTVLRAAHRRLRPDIQCHLRADGRILVRDGVRVSSYGQMFVELAELLSLVDLVVVGDNLVRHGRIKCPDLIDFCKESEMRCAGSALSAVAYVRERVDSPMETRLRMLIVLAGLPEAEVNRTLRTGDGEPLRRYDLSYPTSKVIVEYDGRQHIEREDNWESDLDRREAIDDDGWRILVVTSKGIYREPERTLRRITRLLGSRGMRGLPRQLADDWQPHFPGRD